MSLDAAYPNKMNSRPMKSGWYWVHRNKPHPVPEICFWTGHHFLTIDPSEPALLASDMYWWCGDPLTIPQEFFDVEFRTPVATSEA